jgi:predicted amidohydrolase
MTPIRIALANIRPAASPEDSVARTCNAVARAAEERSAIICFPECYVPGYRFAQSTLPPPDPGFLEKAWAAIAGAAREAGVAVVLGTERVVDSKVRATVLVIQKDGSFAGFQDKVQLDPSEDPTYTPGTERRLFQEGTLTFGVTICHEGWRYPETVRWAAQRGAQVVFHPHFHVPEAAGFRPTIFLDPRNTFHEKAMLCRAAENTVWFASANCAIEGSPTTSAVIRPDGSVLTWQPYGVEGLLVADLDLAEATGLLAKRCL